MESVVPASLAIGGRVGDVFVARLPFHLVAYPLHTGDKTGLGADLLHGLINCSHQPEFKAAALRRRTILARKHRLVFRIPLRFQYFQSMRLTDLIGEGAEIFQILFVKLQFQAGFTTYRIHHQMVVPMIAVDVSGDLDLVTVKIVRKLHTHPVNSLRRNRRSRFEGLYILIEIHALFFPVSALGRHEFLKGGRSAAVLTGHQLDGVSPLVLKHDLFVLRHIPHDLGHGRSALRFLFDRIDDHHRSAPVHQAVQGLKHCAKPFLHFVQVGATNFPHIAQSCDLVEVAPDGLQFGGGLVQPVHHDDGFS